MKVNYKYYIILIDDNFLQLDKFKSIFITFETIYQSVDEDESADSAPKRKLEMRISKFFEMVRLLVLLLIVIILLYQ